MSSLKPTELIICPSDDVSHQVRSRGVLPFRQDGGDGGRETREGNAQEEDLRGEKWWRSVSRFHQLCAIPRVRGKKYLHFLNFTSSLVTCLSEAVERFPLGNFLVQIQKACEFFV